MSTIKFFALGGIDENGKDCYVIDSNNEIFIVNSGIYYANKPILGVDSIVPDFQALQKYCNPENGPKKTIKAIFITSPFKRCYGSLEGFIKEFNVPVYASNLTSKIINNDLSKPIDFNVLTRMTTIEFGEVKVTPFKLTNSMPESFGYVFSVGNENVIFLDDCIVNSSKASLLSNDYINLINLVKDKNNLLIHATGNITGLAGFATPGFLTQSYFTRIFQDNSERIMIAVYSHDIYKINSIINASVLTGKKICIPNLTTCKNLKDMGVNFEKFNIIDEVAAKEVNENIVYILDKHRREFFDYITEVIDEEFENVFVKQNDVFVFANQTINGTEKQEAEIFNRIYYCNVKAAMKIPKNHCDMSAGIEDLKLLVGFIKPNYIIPVSGLHRSIFLYQTEVAKTGIPKNNIIVSNNGQIITYDNGKIQPNTTSLVLQTKILNEEGNVGEDVDADLNSRQMMQQSGLAIITGIIDKSVSKLTNLNVQTFGVTTDKQINEGIITLTNNIKSEFSNKLEEFRDKSNDTYYVKSIKNYLRKEVSKYFGKKCGNLPMSMCNLIFI